MVKPLLKDTFEKWTFLTVDIFKQTDLHYMKVSLYILFLAYDSNFVLRWLYLTSMSMFGIHTDHLIVLKDE